ncbi:MAG: 50S ribosomal protein L24 [Clostridia bacterium]|jgi:large subunit ribosomal protein L24|nr:50S ribosomal protein L24 [Oscillospiraceae bacterium]MBQ8323644.1 50S ribosomal protein L24 [Clostridia bacterium]MBR4054260.1 50S ribosomal protein L24 [Clostridia bacterium]MBR6553335.1 50S ribosomal protein L24 [Clostridia bacterium]
MSKMHVKTGDTVIVISGEYANGKEPAIGKVIGVSPKEGKVMVEGVQIVSKHVKPRRQGEAGGIIKTEGAIYASKVQLYCPNCKAGRRSKVQITEDGRKIRVCAGKKGCGKEI